MRRGVHAGDTVGGLLVVVVVVVLVQAVRLVPLHHLLHHLQERAFPLHGTRHTRTLRELGCGCLWMLATGRR